MRTIKKVCVSLRITIFLLSFLVGWCVLGTLVPQKLEPRFYLERFPGIGTFLLAAGIDDIFHGKVFIGILAFLAVSLFLCTTTRLHLTRKRLFGRINWATSGEIRSMPVRVDLGHDHGRVFADPSGHPPWGRRTLEDGSAAWFRSSGRLSLIGSLFIHLGLLFLLAGGSLDAGLGFEAMIRGKPAEQVPIPGTDAFRAAFRADQVRQKRRNLQQLNPQDPENAVMKNEIERLEREYQKGLASPAFKVCFDKLWMDFSPQGSSETAPVIRGWNTGISITDCGARTASAVIRVNHPFSYMGYSFYQSDWSKKYKDVRVAVYFPDHPPDFSPASSQVIIASPGVPINPSWSSDTFVLLDFWPDFRMVHDEFVSVSDDLNNPAARIAAFDKDGRQLGRAWAFSRKMTELASQVSDLPYHFFIEGAESVPESGVQVTYYPGFRFIVAGCGLFFLGLCLAFFTTYLEEWILKRPDGRMTIAVTGNRPPVVLLRKINRLLAELNIKQEDLDEDDHE